LLGKAPKKLPKAKLLVVALVVMEVKALTTRKSKKVGISDAEPKTQQGLALESNSNKKEMDV
jgi:hypothetical protein